MRPDRVDHADSDRAREVMRQLYRPLYLSETPMLFTDIETMLESAWDMRRQCLLLRDQDHLSSTRSADSAANKSAPMSRTLLAVSASTAASRQAHAGPGFGGSSAFGRTGDRRQHVHPRGRGDPAIVETVVEVNEAARVRGARRQDHRGLRRRCARQDDRHPRPRLQAQYRRHARQPQPRHPAAPRRGGRGDPRLRPGRDRRSEKPDARPRLLRGRL